MFAAARLGCSRFLPLLLLPACAGRPGPPGPGTARPPSEAPPPSAAPGAPITTSPSRLPAVPSVHGPLAISVIYPEPGARVDVLDSSFVFGSVGDGAASLSIDGAPIAVAPNGAWLAWIPFHGDSVVMLHLEARTATDSARLDYRIRRVRRFLPPRASALWVDTTSLTPSGRVWWPSDEYLSITARASEGATLSLILPGGARVPFAADRGSDEVPEALRAFDRDTSKLRRAVRADRYRAVLRGRRLGDPGSLFGNETGAPGDEAVLEAARGNDTVRVRWPLRLAMLDSLPAMAELDDDRAGKGGSDSITVGRAAPAATYTWFFPTGTLARVTGRVNDDLRLSLSSRSSVWVSAAEAWPATGTAIGPAVIGSVTLTPLADRVSVRIPAGKRVPYQVLEEERELTLVLYGAVSDINWLRYGRDDSLVSRVTTRQTGADELELRFTLNEGAWGYHVRWDGADLILEIRRPPVIDQRSPLRGRLIVVDPGHPPAGAKGPTGLTEAEANLAIALELRNLLQAEGARVLMTRTDARSVDLFPRVRFADSANAELLVSIHNNALPDGVNPFLNNGSSAFYNHVRALPLARAIMRELVARFGTRDLGVGRGDLALVRPTWMPAVLTEGLFMMIPQQEAALRSPEGQREYARAVFEGIVQFLRDRARDR